MNEPAEPQRESGAPGDALAAREAVAYGPRTRPRRRWLAPAFFVATCATTVFFGAVWTVGDAQALAWITGFLTRARLADLGAFLAAGLPYGTTVMAFFVAHEFGHYLTCRYYGVDAGAPIFLPAPTLFGTFGAVMRIRSAFPNRRVLFDVGIAGPLAGLIVALPAVTWGILTADAVPPTSGAGFYFGDSLLTTALQHVLRPDAAGMELMVGPVYIAGWLGLLATAMNLCPAGQLDGGHIVYALSPSWHGRISIMVGAFFVALVATRFVLYGQWSVWSLWALVIVVFCRRHPPIRPGREPLGTARVALAVFVLVMLILIFMPHPIELVTG